MSVPESSRGDASAAPTLDARDAESFAAELLRRRAGYVPEWQPGELGAGAALVHAVATFALLQR